MSYFDQVIKQAFPPPPPWANYSFPELTRTGVVTQLATTAYNPGGPGKLIPIPIRTVTTMGLVRTYRFRPAPWHRIGPIRAVRPPQTLLPHSTLAKPGTDPKGASTGRRSFDPYGDFAFHVEIGPMRMAFAKFDGIDVEVDQIEYKDSLDLHPHKRPGIHHYGNIKFTKGVVSNQMLWTWIQGVMAGVVVRLNGSIHVLSDTHDKTKPEITYNFFQAWPCKWSGLRLDGKGQGTLVEELELAVDFVVRGM